MRVSRSHALDQSGEQSVFGPTNAEKYVENALHSPEDGSFVAFDLFHPDFKEAVDSSQREASQKERPSFKPPLNVKPDNFIEDLITTTTKEGRPFRLVIGENHDESMASNIIIRAMQSDSFPAGATIALEGLCYDVYQKILDDWILKAPKNSPIPQELHVLGKEYMDIIRPAKQKGIRILAIDARSINPASVDYSATDNRIMNMNYLAQKIINHEVGTGSFIALVGAAHAADTIDHDSGYINYGLGRLLEDTTSLLMISGSTFEKEKLLSPHAVIIEDIITLLGFDVLINSTDLGEAGAQENAIEAEIETQKNRMSREQCHQIPIYEKGFYGAQRLIGTEGNDILAGNDSHDALYGEDGRDELHGGDGDDILSGGAENDLLYGDSGHDSLGGGTGHDILYGGDGDDALNGGDGNDILHGGDGHDKLYGGAGDDTLHGGHEDDKLYGEQGNDTLHGGYGDDVLSGRSGNDTLHGDHGDDVLSGGEGDDILTGGRGRDVFIYGIGILTDVKGEDLLKRYILAESDSRLYTGKDRIKDFSLIEDKIKISSDISYEALLCRTQQIGDDAVIEFYKDHSLTLENVHLKNLTQDHFLFDSPM